MKLAAAFLAALTVLAPAALAQSPAVKAAADGQQVVDKAVAYFKAQQQANGSWQQSPREPPAVTALVLRVLSQDPKTGPASEPAKRAVAYLLSVQQENGGIYQDMLANYNTAIAVSALASAKDPALKERIDRAVKYLTANQWRDAIAGVGGEKIDPKHPFYGGWGYGGTTGRPDVSNVAIALEALKDAGLAATDPAYKDAVAFLSRLQNNSETNPAPWAGDDGGFVYSIDKDGNGSSAAGESVGPGGKAGPRSYGSMTYAGLKSMIYAGLSKDDPRVKAAWEWVRSNWTLDGHPGMAAAGPENAKAGIFYYYNTVGRALAVYGEPTIVDRKGVSHDWRVELLTKLAAIQKDDGSFVGEPKWMENNPIISTPLAALAAQDALKDLKDRP